LALLTGCQGLNRQRSVGGPLEPDIVAVRTYKGNNPFISLDPAGDPNPEGLRFTYYAISAATGKGCHADGIIRIKIYVVHHPPNAEPYGELVRAHEFTPEQAFPWRVTKYVDHLGWPYQFDVSWGEGDLSGAEVRVVPELVRTDGRVVSAAPWSVKVPARRAEIRLPK
jgi:hypothetical protein